MSAPENANPPMKRDELEPDIRGWPMWEEKCEKLLAKMVEGIETDAERADVYFNADFRGVFDAFVGQMLRWATNKDGGTVAKWAGEATASLFRTLHDNRKDLEQNETFRESEKALRRIRTNLRATPAGRFVDDEVWKAAEEKSWGEVFDSLPVAEQELLGKDDKWAKYRRVYSGLEDFGPETARDWFDKIIWPRLQEREDEFLAEPDIVNSQTYKTVSGKKGRAYISDFQKQFWQATRALSKRPKGHIRGIHRPHW